MTEDEALALALEASAAEARARSDAPLPLPQQGANDGRMRRRVEGHPPLSHHFSLQLVPAAGGVVSRGALDQFSAFFSELIDLHETAGSICGYLTIVNCALLCEALETAEHTVKDDDALVEALLAAIRDPQEVRARCDVVMAAIRERRRAYVAEHDNDFDGGCVFDDFDGREARAYTKAWVANYELSDQLAEFASGASAASRRRLLFLRMNQWPQHADATHEEKARIGAEEARFGGRREAEGAIHYAEGDSFFVIERFGPRKLQSPEEWTADECSLAAADADGWALVEARVAADLEGAGAEELTVSEAHAAEPRVRVLAIDLNGHFTAAFALRHARLGPTLVLGNSTTSEIADKVQVQWAFDLLFRPPSSRADADEERPGEWVEARWASPSDAAAPAASPSDLAELLAMGFEEAAARAALEAGGSLANAVERLVAS